MKLNMEQVEAHMTAAWGTQALVVCYRISGNRDRYVVTDHGEHWLPLETSWIGGREVFEPWKGEWPEPEPDPWTTAVAEAVQRAHAYFAVHSLSLSTWQGDRASLKRLPRAQAIALDRGWVREGDVTDTWLIPSATTSGTVYEVNGRCTCPDLVTWCKHRLAAPSPSAPKRSWPNASQPKQRR